MKEYCWNPSYELANCLRYYACKNEFIDAIVSMIMESWPDPSCIELTAKEGLSSDDRDYISEIVERFKLGDDCFVHTCIHTIEEECQRRVKEKEKS